MENGSNHGGFRLPVYKGAFYQDYVDIPNGDGTYYRDYGKNCPNGCAIGGVCGTPEQCATTFNWMSVVVIGIVVAAIIVLIFWCRAQIKKGEGVLMPKNPQVVVVQSNNQEPLTNQYKVNDMN